MTDIMLNILYDSIMLDRLYDSYYVRQTLRQLLC